MTYSIRQPYDPDLYVGRVQELAKSVEWLENGRKRLLSITSPPATGKTWFLHRVEEEFRNLGAITFWIDVVDIMLSRKESNAKSRRINPELVNEWLKGFVDNVNQTAGSSVTNFDPAADIPAQIERIASDMGHFWYEKNICIFIDNGDQFNGGEWREFERYFLEPFARQRFLRFVIAVQEKIAVQSIALRMSEKRINIEPLTPVLGAEQIDRLRERKLASTSQNIEQLLDILRERDYDLIHPGLNNFICLFATDKPQAISNFNVADVFGSALEAVYPQARDDIDSLVALLYRLSSLPDEWDIEDITEQFQVSRPKAWDYIQILKEYSLIEQNLNRYEIVAGVREFVRAILRGEIFYAVMPDVAVDLPREFHYTMDKWFNFEELKALCFNLQIDTDNALLGESKLSKVIALIKYCQRHNRVLDLLAQCQRLRPHVDWTR